MLNPVAFYPILWARSPPHLPILQDHRAVAFEAQFYFDGTPRDCKLFFTEGDWFQFENCWRNSKFDTRQYTQHQNGIFPSQRFPKCGRTCSAHSLHLRSPPDLPQWVCPSCSLPSWQSIIYPWAHSGLSSKGVSPFAGNKVKHDDIFNRPVC